MHPPVSLLPSPSDRSGVVALAGLGLDGVQVAHGGAEAAFREPSLYRFEHLTPLPLALSAGAPDCPVI